MTWSNVLCGSYPVLKVILKNASKHLHIATILRMKKIYNYITERLITIT